ncbi:thioesterase [Rhizocola hellebori]|uniref:Thioesterase n=1 Tax=Rhizocola hellebori TaxID=1392758 RepID=A0A8J3QA59_9ACTN|nr:thioesterase family protein [Rhizocola hellebori]GIH05870.1 thioesterase [Rhizocola hellebori]
MTTPLLDTFGAVKRLDIHFDDLDPVGVVHNARYAILLERAISLFWHEHGMSFVDSRPSDPDMVAVVREFAITFLAPIRSTGPIDVHFWLDKLGTSSAVYGFRFLSVDHDTAYAEGRRVMVKIDPQTGQPSPWSEQANAIGSTLLR